LVTRIRRTRIGEGAMRFGTKAILAIVHLGIAGTLGSAGAQAQVKIPIALKSGESIEVLNLYSIANCRSLLKSAPEVEILDGPPGVTAFVKEAMVIPRTANGNCAKPVQGGKLVIAAKDIEDESNSTLTLRITYRTRDGDRTYSQVYSLSLFP
jgi:hypothetical protein